MKKLSILYSLLLLSYLHCYAQNTFPSNGNVGLGTAFPGSALTIAGGRTGVSIQPGGSPYFGTLAFNRESATGTIFDSRGFGYQINNGGTDANMHFQVWSGQGDLVTNNAIVIAGNGYVGIGTASPQESLSVNGKIRAQEVKVETANWPDYVFSNQYELPTLQQTEKYIVENGHLPGIPTTAEVAEEGIALGEMNAKLLKKIEELTLHLILLEKVTKNQQKEIDNLKSKQHHKFIKAKS